MKKLQLANANIIHLLGIESLPLDERKEITESAVELVEARTLNRIAGMLDETKQQELIGHLEAENSDAVSEFLNQNQIDLIAITEEEVEKVKQELLEVKKSV